MDNQIQQQQQNPQIKEGGRRKEGRKQGEIRISHPPHRPNCVCVTLRRTPAGGSGKLFIFFRHSPPFRHTYTPFQMNVRVFKI
jgi:hypothetical protein